MRIEKNKTGAVGACNFCNKGKINHLGTRLVYPYDYVFQVSNESTNSIEARFCQECFDHLKKWVAS